MRVLSNSLLLCKKEPPSNFVSDAQRVPMFEFVLCTILSLVPQNFPCVAEMPIKRCSCGSNITKPPSDFPYLCAAAKAGLTKTPL